MIANGRAGRAHPIRPCLPSRSIQRCRSHGGDCLDDRLPDGRVAILLALDEALERFTAIEPAKAELLKLHAFGGLSLAAAAEVLGISPTTADRWWAYARAWLRTEISEEKDP